MVTDNLHDETRARWGAHSPDEFISTVMHGALRHKLDMASIVIHVYAQIVHQYPNASLCIDCPDDAPPSLREVFGKMRDEIANAQTAANTDMSRIPMAFSSERYILHMTNEIWHHMAAIERYALMIEADSRMASMRLPGAKGKSFEDVALDILGQVTGVMHLLEFARSYLDKRSSEMGV